MTFSPSTFLRAAVLSLVCVTAPLAALAQTAPLTYGPPINLEMSKKIAAAAEAEARKNGFTMVISVLDSGGSLVYLERMDGTQLASIDVAIAKGRSANNFKRPTKAFEDAVIGGRNAVLGLPGALPIEGGVLIIIDGKIAGAVGVSGGSAPQDGQVAAAGVAALTAK
jgi:uncharacterized protein GlcG (DUF336 family)